MYCRKSVLLIGSNPSQRSECSVSAFHASTRSRKTIETWFRDIPCDLFFTNVIDHPTENNRPLRVSEIRDAIPSLHHKVTGYNKIVALGKTAAKALDIAGIEYFEMPHPSGSNRKLNDKGWVHEVILKLANYIDS